MAVILEKLNATRWQHRAVHPQPWAEVPRAAAPAESWVLGLSYTGTQWIQL